MTRKFRNTLASILAVAAFGAVAPAADAYVFWAGLGGKVGRANLNGSNQNPSLVTGSTIIGGLAVSGSRIYWSNFDGIGRSNLDGTGATQSFITSALDPQGVAVDGNYIYWANYNSIGRANLDGSNKTQSFITGAPGFEGIAVDSAHIYWVNTLNGTIGRANLNGTGVNQSFITGASYPMGVAVDGSHIYWTNERTDTIGRANLDGSNKNQSFINGTDDPGGIAVDSNHIYWANFFGVGRADLNGLNVNQSFFNTEASEVVAVNSLDSAGALSPSSNAFGNQAVTSGPTSDATFTLSSSGTTPLTIPASGVSLAGANADQFQITDDGTCSAGSTSLSNGQSCTVTVAFNPTSTGAKSATLRVQTSEATKTATLTGTGTEPVGSLSPSSNAFGDQPVTSGPTSAATFTLASSGTADLTIPESGITLTQDDANQFQITGGTCSAGSSSLSNGQSCTVTVAFDPTSVGDKDANLQVITNDGTKTADLKGVGTSSDFSISPFGWNFGNRKVSTGVSNPASFTLASTGSAALNIQSDGISLGGGNPGQFRITGGTCESGGSVPIGESCSVEVGFDPSRAGSASAALEIETSAGLAEVDLDGTGTVDPVLRAFGQPGQRALKVRVGCGNPAPCRLSLTINRVSGVAPLLSREVSVGAGKNPVLTFRYTALLRKVLRRDRRVRVIATNVAAGTAAAIIVRVRR